MSYYKPVTTISSIGTISQPIPVTIASASEPTTRDNGGTLRQGDNWYNNATGDYYVYVDGQWQKVGDSTPPIPLGPATTTSLGGVIVGNGLAVTQDGTLSINSISNVTLQTLQVNGTSTLHTIVTGSNTDGVAINASAGSITSKWINLTKNPTTDTNDTNYGVSLRTTGTIITPEANVSVLSGPRQGLVYKLTAGDGLTFENQASSHIGGTVGAAPSSGNQYTSNSGTLSVGPSVLRATDTQTIVGDLVVEKAATDANPTRTGTIKTEGIKLTSPNGTEYLVTVGDDGTLVSTAI